MIFCTRWVVYATHRVLLLFQKSRKGTVLRYFLFLRKVLKGFSFVCVKPLLRRAESRFAEPRSFPIRETVLFFSLVRKEPKVPQRFANLWTPGTIQISARFEIFAEMTGHHQVTGHTGHCNLPGYRRLGFESVRKESSTLDARLRSFENGLFCCKLTVGFHR